MEETPFLPAWDFSAFFPNTIVHIAQCFLLKMWWKIPLARKNPFPNMCFLSWGEKLCVLFSFFSSFFFLYYLFFFSCHLFSRWGIKTGRRKGTGEGEKPLLPLSQGRRGERKKNKKNPNTPTQHRTPIKFFVFFFFPTRGGGAGGRMF